MSPRDKNTKVAFWLVPAREEVGFLAQLIQALATRYEALVFEPHVTIFSTDAALLDSPEAVLKTAVEEVYAFPLTVAGCTTRAGGLHRWWALALEHTQNTTPSMQGLQ